MGLRNQKTETLGRLRSKTLDAQFLREIQQGLNCSPFEAQAVLEVVKEVYLPFLGPDVVKAPPGKITLVALGADETSGKPMDDCRKQTVCLTLHRGEEDDRLLQERGCNSRRAKQLREVPFSDRILSGFALARESCVGSGGRGRGPCATANS